MARPYTRHELKQDRFAETVADKVSWVVDHRRKLEIAGTAVSVIVVLLVAGWFYLQYRDKQAGVELSSALRIYGAPLRQPNAPAPPSPSFGSAVERAQAANKAFREIQQKYRLTRSADLAGYFAAVTAQEMGDTATAERELKEMTSSRNPDFAGRARFALASLYRASNREGEAVKIYQELIKEPPRSVPKTLAQLELASLYEEKQPAEAARIYKQIREENPRDPAAEIAGERMAGLKP